MPPPAPPPPAAPPTGPREDVIARLGVRRAEVATGGRRAARLARLRLLAFALLVTALGAALAGAAPAVLALPPLAVFAALVVVHARTLDGVDDAARRVALHERTLARLEDRWAGSGATGDGYRPPHHLYASDLDVLGPGSLFQRLCVARTRAGEATLAAWLLEGAPADEVRRRQEAARELAAEPGLREEAAVRGGAVRGAADRDLAAAWGGEPPRLTGRVLPWVYRALGALSATLLALWLLGPLGPRPFALALLVQALCVLPVRGRAAAVLAAAERPGRDLLLLAPLLELLEEARFTSPWLRALVEDLAPTGTRPSAALRGLLRRLDLVDARRNQVFLPVSWLLNVGVQLAFGLEAWRARHGASLARWRDGIGRFEAMLSLGAYAFECPDDAWPEVVDGGPRLEGEGVGHPLLPRARCVRNDVALAVAPGPAAAQALLVSGSNMSGKSTWLRTLGVSVVLARAGAPVRARRLVLSSLEPGASIRIQDSLQEGASRFYAEIERLKAIVDLARRGAALFLLDEVLHGTNSHDRRIGAEAVLRALLDARAIGLATTHDLALAAVADADPRMLNVHFEDRIEDGRVAFDHRLRPGVVTHSNAIELMRSVGLDVPDAPPPV